MKEILRVLVGSRCHGVHRPDSDYDYRSVFVQPTCKMLSLKQKPAQSHWNIDNNTGIDETGHEIGKFLMMAAKSNPTVLEVFKAPRVDSNNVLTTQLEATTTTKIEADDWMLGSELRALFPYVWSSKAVMNAFIGYGINQQKKMLQRQDKRAKAHAVAYLRVLYQGYMLLSSDKLPVHVVNTIIGPYLLKWKYDDPLDVGEVINICLKWQERVKLAYEERPDKVTNYEPLDEFLLKVRRNYWSG